MKSTKKIISILFLCVFLLAFTIGTIQTVDAATEVPTVENLTTQFSGGVVTVKWSKVNSCSGYELQYSKDSAFVSNVETVVIANPSTTSHKIQDEIEPDDTYFFRIRAYVDGSTKTYSNWTEPNAFAYNLTVPSLYTPNVGEDKVSVSFWISYSAYIDGFELQYSPSSNFTSVQESIVIENRQAGSYSFVNTSLAPSTNYYFRIRSYKIIGNNTYYSKWSEVEDDSYEMEVPYIKDVKIEGTKFTAEWDHTKTPNYIIEISKTNSFAEKIEIKDFKSNKYTTDLVLKSDTKYYLRVRSDKTGLGQSKWSSVRSFTYQLDTCKFDEVKVENNNILLNWTDNYDGCEIQFSEYSDMSVSDTFTTTKGQTDYTIQKLNPGTYHVRIRYYNNVDALFYGEQTNYSAWSSKTMVQIKPDVPKMIGADIQTTKIDFTYAPVEKVSGYEIQCSDSPTFENAKIIATTWRPTSESYTDYSELVPQRKYYFRIRAFVDTKSSDCYSDWSEYVTDTLTLTKTYIKTQKVENNNIIFNWLTINGHDGYQIQYGYDPSLKDCKTVRISASYTSKYTIEDPKPGVCYFRIRTVHTVSGTDYYSDWSNIKNISFKVNKTYLTNQYVENDKIKVVWKNAGDAVYEFQYSKNPDFSDSKSASVTTSKNTKDKIEYTINDSDLTPGTYYIRVRVGCESDNDIYYSDWSNAKTFTYKLNKTYIKNLKISEGKLKVDWLVLDGCTGYQIQYGTDSTLAKSEYIDITGAEQDVHYIDLAPGTYYARIRACKTVDGRTYYSDWSNIKNITCSISKTYLTNQYISNNKGHIVWKAVEGVDGYEIQMSSDKDFLTMSTTVLKADAKASKYSNIDIVPGTTYFRIRTFKTLSGKTYYSDWSNAKTITYTSLTSSISSVYSQYNKLYLNWTKNMNVSGYEVQYSTDSTFAQNVQTFETLANDITQTAVTVTPGTYHIRVRTYQKANEIKTYSNWSDVKSFEFKFDVPQFTSAKSVDNSIVLEWAVSKGCHGYHIEYSTDSQFKQNVKTVQIYNTNTLSNTINNLVSGYYYVRICAYKKIDNQKFFSDWSEGQLIKIN